MLKNLPLVSMSMLVIFGIDVATILSPVLRINFSMIYMDSEFVLSINLLFGRMISLMKRFH